MRFLELLFHLQLDVLYLVCQLKEELIEFFLGLCILGKIIFLKSDSAVSRSQGSNDIIDWFLVLFDICRCLLNLLLLSWFFWLSLWWCLFLLSLFALFIELLDLLVKHVENQGLLIFFHIIYDLSRFLLWNAIKDCFNATLGCLQCLLVFFDDWGTDELVEVGLDLGIDGISISIFTLLDPVERKHEITQHLLRKHDGGVALPTLQVTVDLVPRLLIHRLLSDESLMLLLEGAIWELLAWSIDAGTDFFKC